MALPKELIDDFVKITNYEVKNNGETVYGTVVVDGSLTYVRLDGSDVLTPVTTTTNIKNGERVTVLVKNHSATVTGNLSSPAARTAEVEEVGGKVENFDKVMSHNVTTDELEATNALIDTLKSRIAQFDNMEAVNAEIDSLRARLADFEYISADDMKVINADIENIRAMVGTFTDLSTEDLKAINADIDNLKSYTATFTYVSADALDAVKANIKSLNVEKANIDFANINQAAITKIFSESGIIKDLVTQDGHITGELVGVTIKGDLIEGNTIKADKLVVLGENGLYYKLNVNALGESTAASDEKYQHGLDGSAIVAKSITADRVNVTDLVAFGATIGGFKIGTNSIYSGVKESINNTTRGIYFDTDGQFYLGDANNFIRFYKDQNGNYKLRASMENFAINLNGTSTEIEQAFQDVQSDVDKLRDEITTLLRIESSRGTVFKNDQVSTVLSVVIYHGTQRITDDATMKSVFGSSAYLQWKWQRLDDNSFGVIPASDSRFGADGFTFTLSPEDVDTKITFMCELIT